MKIICKQSLFQKTLYHLLNLCLSNWISNVWTSLKLRQLKLLQYMFFSRPVWTSCCKRRGEAVNFLHGLKILGCSTDTKVKQGSLVREVAWAAVSRISSPVLSFWSGLKSLKYLEFGKGSQWGWVKSPIIWVPNKVPIKTFPNSKTRLILEINRWNTLTEGDIL